MKNATDFLSATAETDREPTTVLEIGMGCNNQCSFCPSAGKSYEIDFDAICDRIRNEAARGSTSIVFAGREPTIVPQFVKIVAAARDSGFSRIRLETNGRMFAYERFTRDALAAGITEIAVRLAAPDSETALKINPAPDAFNQTLKGIKNILLAGGVQITASVPVVPENAASLTDIVAIADKLNIGRISFRIMEPGGSPELDANVDAAVMSAGRLGMFVEVRGGGRRFAPALKDYRIEKEDDEFCVDTFFEIGSPPKKEFFSRDLRITYRCNQNCIFCGVDKKAAPDPNEKTDAAIREAVSLGIPRLNISGGEPTLNPNLIDYIRLAKEGGVWEVTLMTNAVLCSDSDLCGKLKAAGLDKVFVSLHAPEQELSDALTRCNGGFIKTIKGIKNLIDAGINTGLIFVLCSKNAACLDAYVRFTAENFGATPVFCSYVTPYYDPTLPADMVPGYSTCTPYIKQAFKSAAALGVPISFMEEQHGIPECILPGRSEFFRNLFAPISKSRDAGFIKADGCCECRENDSCPGIRKYYALLHGLDELKPITARHG